MNYLNFYKIYPNKEHYKLKFKEMRDKQGVVCSHFGSKEYYWKGSKWVYKCKKCSFYATLCSGTVMHGPKLLFRYWFISMHLLTSIKKFAKYLQATGTYSIPNE